MIRDPEYARRVPDEDVILMELDPININDCVGGTITTTESSQVEALTIRPSFSRPPLVICVVVLVSCYETGEAIQNPTWDRARINDVRRIKCAAVRPPMADLMFVPSQSVIMEHKKTDLPEHAST